MVFGNLSPYNGFFNDVKFGLLEGCLMKAPYGLFKGGLGF